MVFKPSLHQLVVVALAVFFLTSLASRTTLAYADNDDLLNLGLGAHVGLPNLLHAHIGANAVVGGAAPLLAQENFVRAHHEHFLFLNNRYVFLPETAACPAGSELNAVTGQCTIVSQTIVENQAPTILAEQESVPATIREVAPTSAETATETTETTTAAPTVASETASTVTTQETVQPTITCPQGSTLNGNTCQASQTTVENVQPIVTCPQFTTLQNGVCVEQQQQIVVQPLPCPQCPPGATNVNGQCIVTATPSEVIQGQTDGQIIIAGHTFTHLGDLPFLHGHFGDRH